MRGKKAPVGILCLRYSASSDRSRSIPFRQLPEKKAYLFVNGLTAPFSTMLYSSDLRQYDNKIIECSFRNGRWVFHRQRTDKSFPNAKGLFTFPSLSLLYQSISLPSFRNSFWWVHETGLCPRRHRLTLVVSRSDRGNHTSDHQRNPLRTNRRTLKIESSPRMNPWNRKGHSYCIWSRLFLPPTRFLPLSLVSSVLSTVWQGYPEIK